MIQTKHVRWHIVLLLIFLNVPAIAQEKSKRAITADDYATWKTVSREAISHDGSVVIYELNPQQGDGNLIIHQLNSHFTDTLPRGTRAKLDGAAQFVVSHIKPPADSIRTAKLKKVKKEDMPADSLAVYTFSDHRTRRFAGVKSYSLPDEGSDWVAILTQPAAGKDTTRQESKKSAKKVPGDDLLLLNAISGDTLIIKRVTAFQFAKKAGRLVFSQEYNDSVRTYTKLSLFNSDDASISILLSDEGTIKNPVLDEKGTKVAFLHTRDTSETRIYALRYGLIASGTTDVVTDIYTSGLPVGWSPSVNETIRFSQDGSKLFFGTSPSPIPEEKDTLLPEEKPVVDIWHWKDDAIQPQQKAELDKEKKRTYLAVYHTQLNRFIQLADLNIRDIITISKGNGAMALGFDYSPYRREDSWTGSRHRDVYLVDLPTGIKRQMITAVNYAQLSPGGKYLIWYNPADSAYYSRSTDLADTKVRSITRMIPVRFCNEKHDSPGDASPYGIAGWAPGDRFVYIYDRFDIWKIDPSGERVPVSVTQAFGRRNNISFRYVKTNPEEEYIPSETNILLRAFHEISLESGFYTADFSAIKEPRRLFMDNHHYTFISKAKDTETLIWKKENTALFPDLWMSDQTFSKTEKLSNANPQQHDFIWSTSELVEWNSISGEQLRGILYKPENFNPSKKYPMVIYFYERMSETIHRYVTPAPSRSTINRTMYPSNGYLVFVPDITYRHGFPGQSAFDAIVSGAMHLISTASYVDREKIGIQGQSWGGYQVAYLITRTNMFAAAMAGAPVSNMTSAYGGVRWETGLSRMFQYEKTQSRIGGTLWEKPMNYYENSPLFYVPQIETPLLMMHNDNDGAVPWYQGIEMFLALRRLDKPVWMLNYNNEPHNLKEDSWANRIDLDRRMFQFFNHYLKGYVAPDWMKYGIPAIDKGKKTGY